MKWLVALIIFWISLSYVAPKLHWQGCDRFFPWSLTAGYKALKKCHEYYSLISPCSIKVDTISTKRNTQRCNNINRAAIFDDPKVKLSNGRYPFLVQMYYPKNNNYNEKGILISDEFVLSLAYRAKDFFFGKVERVVLSSLDPPLVVKVKELIFHPELSATKNDIALLRLEEKLDLVKHNIYPACLPSIETTSDNYFLGYLREKDEVIKYNFNIKRNEDCFKLVGKIDMNEVYNLCFDNCYDNSTCSEELGKMKATGIIVADKVEPKCIQEVLTLGSYVEGSEIRLVYEILPYVPWIESVVWPGPPLTALSFFYNKDKNFY